MRNEHLLKHLRHFRVVAVAPEGSLWSELCEGAGECSAMCYAEVSERSFQANPHLVLLAFDAARLKDPHFLGALKRIREARPWQIMLFCDEADSPVAREFALKLHAYGPYSTPESGEALRQALLTALPGMIERLQEQTRAAQLQKISDLSPAQVLLSGSGKVLVANRKARELFGSRETAEIGEKLAETGIGKGVGSDVGVVNVEIGDGKYLLHKSGEEGGGTLLTFVVSPFGCEEGGGSLSRVECIERLKDRMAQHLESESAMHLLTARIANYETIIRNYGWMRAHAVVKELLVSMTNHFGPTECAGVWHKDMPVLLFGPASFEASKEALESFAKELGFLDFGDDVALSVDFVLIEAVGEDLNGIINVVERSYEGDLSVADTRGVRVFGTGSGSRAEADEEELLLQLFTNIMANHQPLKLFNIYKGLPISTPATILKVEEGRILLKVEKIQKFVIELEQKVVMQSPNLPKDVEAEVYLVDARKPLVMVKRPRLLHASLNNRKHTRVGLPSRLPVVIKVEKKHYTGYLRDISIRSAAAYFNAGKFAEEELKGKKARISFRLPWENEEGSVTLDLGAEILFNRDEGDEHKVVLVLEHDETSESRIFDYVYRRQRELIREIKSKIV